MNEKDMYIESLKRLLKKGSITEEQLIKAVSDGLIDDAAKTEIIAEQSLQKGVYYDTFTRILKDLKQAACLL